MALVDRLRGICGTQNVVADTPGISAYAPSQGWPAQTVPVAIVLPGNRSEVAAVLRAVSEAGARFVIRGAGSSSGVDLAEASNGSQRGGLARSTSANPPRPSVVVALTRLRRMLAVAPDAREVSCEPGIPLDALRRACGPVHTVLPDVEAVVGATVGGVIAAGAGRAELLGIELVTSGGQTATLDRRQPGYDLTGAFVGSGGSGGAAVALRLRLRPRSGDER